MEFRDTYLQKSVEAIHNTEANNDVSDISRYNLELDFVEQYKDADGVLHIKTFFNHDNMDESDIWEVFDTKDGSNSLELLLNDTI